MLLDGKVPPVLGSLQLAGQAIATFPQGKPNVFESFLWSVDVHLKLTH